MIRTTIPEPPHDEIEEEKGNSFAEQEAKERRSAVCESHIPNLGDAYKSLTASMLTSPQTFDCSEAGESTGAVLHFLGPLKHFRLGPECIDP